MPRNQTFPALFGLYANGFLPEGIHIIGYARTKMDDAVSLEPRGTHTSTPTEYYFFPF